MIEYIKLNELISELTIFLHNRNEEYSEQKNLLIRKREKSKEYLTKFKEELKLFLSIDKRELINTILSCNKASNSKNFRTLLYAPESVIAFQKFNVDILFIRTGERDTFIDRNTDRELTELLAKYEIYCNEIEKLFFESDISKSDENQDIIIDKVYSKAKDKGLNNLNYNQLKMIAIEIDEWKNIKSSQRTYMEAVKSKLFEDILNRKNKSDKYFRITIPNNLRSTILTRDGNKCQLCGDTSYLEMGHKKPVSRGGDNSPDNLITLCRKCNSSIGIKEIK